MHTRIKKALHASNKQVNDEILRMKQDRHQALIAPCQLQSAPARTRTSTPAKQSTAPSMFRGRSHSSDQRADGGQSKPHADAHADLPSACALARSCFPTRLSTALQQYPGLGAEPANSAAPGAPAGSRLARTASVRHDRNKARLPPQRYAAPRAIGFKTPYTT